MRPNSGRIPILQIGPLLHLIGRPAQRGCDRPRLPPDADAVIYALGTAEWRRRRMAETETDLSDGRKVRTERHFDYFL